MERYSHTDLYLKGLEDGGKLSERHERIAQNIVKLAVESPYLGGFKSGHSQFLKEEKERAHRSPWNDPNRLTNAFNHSAQYPQNTRTMEEHIQTQEEKDAALLQKGQEDGFDLAQWQPDIAKHLINIESELPYLEGIRSGYAEFEKQLSRDRDGLHLRPSNEIDRTAYDNPFKEASKELQPEQDKTVDENQRSDFPALLIPID
jgi:hypothetical protein